MTTAPKPSEMSDDTLNLLMEYTRNSRADVLRFIGAAEACGYVFTRAPSGQQGERVTVDAIFDLIYRNYNEKPCAETTKMILDFAVRANAAFDIFKKPIIVKDKE
jgi:hypothetical protein